MLVISKKCCQLLFNTATVFLRTIAPFNRTGRSRIPMKIHKNGALNISHHSLTRIIGPRTVQISILWTIAYGTNSEKVMQWDLVTSKTTLIAGLKRTVRRIRQDVVFESCRSWTNRFYRLSQEKENYLR
jgi:hypothetical protein